ncbi:MAG: hypothetical protein KDH96_03975 [Candidatus Riesia sp.]|nr:hypothetical protein [Candidatus Riesia sp.]
MRNSIKYVADEDLEDELEYILNNVDNIYEKLLTTYNITNNSMVKDILNDLEKIFDGKDLQGISYER